jgi:hypothetical protein
MKEKRFECQECHKLVCPLEKHTFQDCKKFKKINHIQESNQNCRKWKREKEEEG